MVRTIPYHDDWYEPYTMKTVDADPFFGRTCPKTRMTRQRRSSTSYIDDCRHYQSRGVTVQAKHLQDRSIMNCLFADKK